MHIVYKKVQNKTNGKRNSGAGLAKSGERYYDSKCV